MSANAEDATVGGNPTEESRAKADAGGRSDAAQDAKTGDAGQTGGTNNGDAGTDKKTEAVPPPDKPPQFYPSGNMEAADASVTDAEPPANMTLSKGKNPATGQPWLPLEKVIINHDERRPVKLPPAEVQLAGAFYHPRAAEICAHFGNYKLVKAKGE